MAQLQMVRSGPPPFYVLAGEIVVRPGPSPFYASPFYVVYYLDASAFGTALFRRRGSAKVAALVLEAEAIGTCLATQVEVIAAFAKGGAGEACFAAVSIGRSRTR